METHWNFNSFNLVNLIYSANITEKKSVTWSILKKISSGCHQLLLKIKTQNQQDRIKMVCMAANKSSMQRHVYTSEAWVCHSRGFVHLLSSTGTSGHNFCRGQAGEHVTCTSLLTRSTLSALTAPPTLCPLAEASKV